MERQKEILTMKRCGLFIFILLSDLLLAQEPDMELRSAGAEEHAALAAGEWEGQQVRLEYYRRHPIDLNRATADELAELGILNALQISSWLRFRAAFGMAKDWNVFQSVPGWDESTVMTMKPYARLSTEGQRVSQFLKEKGQQFILFRYGWQQDRSLPKAVFGSPAQLLVRYQFNGLHGMQLGFLMEKDAGELYWKRGPAFWSAHLRWQGRRGITWLLGDHTMQFGQGLICWQSMSFGVGSDLTAIKRQGMTMRPYQSVGESRFMRGLAIGKLSGPKQWSVFVSAHPQSATLYDWPTVGKVFRQVDASGLHRTPLEYAKKNALIEYTSGGRFGWFYSGGRICFNLAARRWSLPRIDVSDPFVSGVMLARDRLNASVDFSYTRGPFHSFGEWAVDRSGRVAGVVGLVCVLARSFDVSYHVRGIGSGFRSVDGQAFQQAASVRTEEGAYLQARWRMGSFSTVDAFVDLYRVPLDPNGVPSLGGQIRGLKWQYQPDKKTALYVRVQSVHRERTGGTAELPLMHTYRLQSVRLHGQVSLQEQLDFSFRVEQVRVRPGNSSGMEQGFLVYGELRFAPPVVGFRADVRCMWVSTGGWDSRIYAYERDVLYKTGFPAFSGDQFRFYVNSMLSLGQKLAIWIRFESTKIFDNQLVNSIGRSTLHGFTLQFRYMVGESGR